MKVRTLLVLAFAGLLTASCTFEGGGWMVGDEGGKATMGFDVDCEDTSVAAITYADKKNVGEGGPVNIKAIDVTGCDADVGTGGLYGTLSGNYRPQPKGAPGTFEMYFEDTGQQGPDKGDFVRITLTGGKYDGYTHEGTVEGGNVVIEDAFDPCTIITCP
jgi:hypothetical protein